MKEIQDQFSDENSKEEVAQHFVRIKEHLFLENKVQLTLGFALVGEELVLPVDQKVLLELSVRMKLLVLSKHRIPEEPFSGLSLFDAQTTVSLSTGNQYADVPFSRATGREETQNEGSV